MQPGNQIFNVISTLICDVNSPVLPLSPCRWRHTPEDDAIEFKHPAIAEYIKNFIETHPEQCEKFKNKPPSPIKEETMEDNSHDSSPDKEN